MRRKGKRNSFLPYVFMGIVPLLLAGFIFILYETGKNENAVPFTVSVDTSNKEITELAGQEMSWFDKTAEFVYEAAIILNNSFSRFKTLATPEAQTVNIYPGARMEEIAGTFAKKLGWDKDTEKNFIAMASSDIGEGRLSPGVYVVTPDTNEEKIQEEMKERFQEEVLARYATSTKSVVSLEVAITVASMIQREAAGKNDMRLISGIIWNRIFKDMPLGMDATLQYAKGSEDSGWWPKLTSKDKFIDSPYNTYKNKGLPPTPISSPSLSAVAAALNPKKTKCLFYIHDQNRQIHCSTTYEEHKRNIENYYAVR